MAAKNCAGLSKLTQQLGFAHGQDHLVTPIPETVMMARASQQLDGIAGHDGAAHRIVQPMRRKTAFP
jgi:hypothetical protein